MALSSYGSKKNKFYKLIKKMVSLNKDGTFSLDQNYFKQNINTLPNFYTEKFVKTLGPIRKKEINSRKGTMKLHQRCKKFLKKLCFICLKI